MIAFAFATGAAPCCRGFFSTPIPYALLVLTLVVVTPAYLLLHRWVGLSLPRFVAVAGLIGLALFAVAGSQWRWHPAFLQGPGPLWAFGFPLTGALAYWLVLDRLAPHLRDRGR